MAVVDLCLKILSKNPNTRWRKSFSSDRSY